MGQPRTVRGEQALGTPATAAASPRGATSRPGPRPRRGASACGPPRRCSSPPRSPRPLVVVLNGSGPSFADARRTRDELAPAVGDGRLPLCLSNEQRRRDNPGSLVEIVHSTSLLPSL